jgi:predicted DNA-binding transcriptional regulator YafY
MSHPTTRVLTLLELLQSRSHLSGADIAQRLDVDRRTVRRYVSALQDLGVPVESEVGRYGGYRLRPGYKLPPMMFTEDEALALVFGLLLSRRLAFGDATANEGALAKIDRVLPDRLRARLQAIQGTLAFTPVRGFGPVADPATLLALTGAAQAAQRVWIRYGGVDDVTEREIDPYGVVHHRGRWYIVGYCHLRDDVRMFRLDRVAALEPRDDLFARPLDFDCVAYVLQSLATLPYGWPIEVLLELPLADVQRRLAPDVGTLEETADGVLLRTQAEELDWFARTLVQIGCPFRIQHPPELNVAVKRLARELSRQAGRAPRRLRRPARSSTPRAVPRTPEQTRPAALAAAGRTQSPAASA